MQSDTQLKEESRRMIPSMKPYFPEEDIDELLSGFEEIIRSGRLTLGKYTAKFEESFANFIGVKHAVAANSGTATLEMIYRAIGVQGREVITPTNTHIATSNAVLYSGGKPVLADIDPDSLCLSVEDAFAKVTQNTKAMVVVHVAGLIHPRIDEIRERCSALGLVLIEDAAHAHGASKGGKRAGSLSEAASFSFYPAKVITSIEGGMVTTNDDRIADISRELRNHGSDPKSGLQVRLGYNWRMSEIHSLIGLTQLSRINEIIEHKTEVARVYAESGLSQIGATPIPVPDDTIHSYYKYPMTLGHNIDPSSVQNKLKRDHGIETGSIYYPPCHLQPIYMDLFGYHEGSLSISEDVLKRTITLPIFADMKPDDAAYVADCLSRVLRQS